MRTRQPIYIFDGESMQKMIDLIYKLAATVEVMFDDRKYHPNSPFDSDLEERAFLSDIRHSTQKTSITDPDF